MPPLSSMLSGNPCWHVPLSSTFFEDRCDRAATFLPSMDCGPINRACSLLPRPTSSADTKPQAQCSTKYSGGSPVLAHLTSPPELPRPSPCVTKTGTTDLVISSGDPDTVYNDGTTMSTVYEAPSGSRPANEQQLLLSFNGAPASSHPAMALAPAFVCAVGLNDPSTAYPVRRHPCSINPPGIFSTDPATEDPCVVNLDFCALTLRLSAASALCPSPASYPQFTIRPRVSVPIPQGATVIGATLAYNNFNKGNDPTLLTLTESFGATETWNSCCGGSPGDDFVQLLCSPVFPPKCSSGLVPSPSDLVPPGAKGKQFYDVSDDVQAWVHDPDTAYGWAILPGGTDDTVMYTSEHSANGNHPKLCITWTMGCPVEDLCPPPDGDPNLGPRCGQAVGGTCGSAGSVYSDNGCFCPVDEVCLDSGYADLCGPGVNIMGGTCPKALDVQIIVASGQSVSNDIEWPHMVDLARSIGHSFDADGTGSRVGLSQYSDHPIQHLSICDPVPAGEDYQHQQDVAFTEMRAGKSGINGRATGDAIEAARMDTDLCNDFSRPDVIIIITDGQTQGGAVDAVTAAAAAGNGQTIVTICIDCAPGAQNEMSSVAHLGSNLQTTFSSLGQLDTADPTIGSAVLAACYPFPDEATALTCLAGPTLTCDVPPPDYEPPTVEQPNNCMLYPHGATMGNTKAVDPCACGENVCPGTVCELECEAGYTQCKGSPELTCDPGNGYRFGGKWKPIPDPLECIPEDPTNPPGCSGPAPDNGRWLGTCGDYTPVGCECPLVCDDGFELSGGGSPDPAAQAMYIQCVDGPVWDPVAIPTCVPTTCPEPCAPDQYCGPEGECVCPPEPSDTANPDHVCTPLPPDPCDIVQCIPPNEQCYIGGVCVLPDAICSWEMKADGTLCDDGVVVTVNDRCEQGVCTGEPQEYCDQVPGPGGCGLGGSVDPTDPGQPCDCPVGQACVENEVVQIEGHSTTECVILPPTPVPTPFPPPVCVNDKPDLTGTPDEGCDSATPFCDGLPDAAGEACFPCLDTAAGPGQDTGCPGNLPVCDVTAPNQSDACNLCINTDVAAGTDVGCPASAPLCDSAHNTPGNDCLVCRDTAPDGEQDLACPVDQPICDALVGQPAECVVCLDTEPTTGQDAGCPSEKPLCQPPATPAGAPAVCLTCIDDNDAGQDTGCPANQPMCSTTGTASDPGMCHQCINDQIDPSSQDIGCPLNMVCAGPDGGPGIECLPNNLCTNDQELLPKDNGCTTELPLCGAAPGQTAEAGHCYLCEDDQTGATPDLGCLPETPICVGTHLGFGTECVACIDDDQTGGTDTGCPNLEASQCDNAGPSGICHKCVDDSPEQDSGCPAETPFCLSTVDGGFADMCVVCVDDQSGSDMDSGCPQPDALLCDPTLNVCNRCIDDNSGATGDSGCTLETPFCINTALGDFGQECGVCIDDATGGSTDSGCVAGDTPLCVVTPGGMRECVACVDDMLGVTDDSGCNQPGLPLCVATQDGHSECVLCVDDMPGVASDTGCSSSSVPLCVIDPDGTRQCTVCINDAVGGAADSGCADPSAPLCATPAGASSGTECRVCIDDATQGQPDSGCTDPAMPICLPAAASSPFGDDCVVCVDDILDHTGGAPDSGCPLDNPICAAGVCVKCINDDTTGGDSGCPDASHAHCDAQENQPGTECKKCLDTQTGATQDAGCTNPSTPICDAPVGKTGDICLVCIDDQTGSAVDTGCGSGSPLCMPTATGNICVVCVNDDPAAFPDSGCRDPSQPLCLAVQGESGTECVLCINDDPAGGPDSGCADSALMFCDAEADQAGQVCRVCINDAVDGTADSGCADPAKPLCEGGNDGGAGSGCHHCVNDASGDQPDTGCTDPDAMLCNAAVGDHGDVCVACQNDLPGGSADSGCGSDPDAPLCNSPAGQPGSECMHCVDDASGTGFDTGCTSFSHPICDAPAAGQAGLHCVPCVDDDQADTAQDTGCVDTARPLCVLLPGNTVSECVACLNDQLQALQDTGCPPESPLCDAPAGSAGSTCEVCLNDAQLGEPDTGCLDAANPMCQAAQGGYGPICGPPNPCFNDQTQGAADVGCDDPNLPMCDGEPAGKPGVQCMKCQNDVTGDTPDSGCTDPALPLCVASNDGFGSICVQCINDQTGSTPDTGCASIAAAPLCNAGTGLPGTTCAVCINNHVVGTLVPDTGCSDPARPFCDAASGQFGSECTVCINDQAGAPADTGCTDPVLPFCDAPSGTRGTECKTCMNDVFDGQSQDAGCTVENPQCLAPLGGLGDACGPPVGCTNDKTDATPDSGCGDPQSPLCDALDGNLGDQCFLCQNTKVGGAPDLGCDPLDNPVCVASPFRYGTHCAVCINDNQLGAPDAGCTDLTMPLCGGLPGAEGSKCYSCINDQAGNSADSGCDDPTSPLCDALPGKYGDSCVVCRNDHLAESPDLGCTDPNLPLCDAAPDASGQACHHCVNDASTPLVDSGCPDPATPVCVAPPGNFGESCVVCADTHLDDASDDGCTDSSKPLCDTSKNVPVCLTCMDTDFGAGVDLGCPQHQPLCGPAGTCLKCIDDQPGSTPDLGCRSINAALCLSSEERCVHCINDVSGALQDSGCTDPTAPLCDAPGGESGSRCIVCLNDNDQTGADALDSGCPAEKPLCDAAPSMPGAICAVCINDEETFSDTGCDDPLFPLCDAAAGKLGQACVERATCVNDRSAGASDTGCDGQGLPLCNGRAGQAGNQCMKCINDRESAAADSGCTDPSLPICLAEYTEFGSQCVVCVDDDQGDGSSDSGCPPDAPLCNAPAAGEHGTVCMRCRNDGSDSTQDTGCDPAAPLCDSEPGQPGAACAACTNDATGSSPDSGCTDPAAPLCAAAAGTTGSLCVVCLNDNSGASTDTGCEQFDHEPLCNSAPGAYGTECGPFVFCTNDQVEGAQDTGCPADTPLCEAPQGGPGLKCAICVNDMKEDGSGPHDDDDYAAPLAPEPTPVVDGGESKLHLLQAHIDSGCKPEDGTAHCDAPPGEHGSQCTLCFNDASGISADTGCDDPALPQCDAVPQQSGNQCVRCTNDKTGDKQDSGCSDTDRICDAPDGQAGSSCVACLNDQAGFSSDSGCVHPNLPMCDSQPGAAGTLCALCMNDQDTGQDTGCTVAGFPLCLAPQGAFGSQCVACVNNLVGEVMDDGCIFSHPLCAAPDSGPGVECFQCTNDREGAEADSGCSDPSEPICNVASHKYGNACVRCINDQTSSDEVDSGCSADQPLCNGAPGSAGTNCFFCLNDNLGGQADSGCTSDHPLCFAPFGLAGTSCHSCINDQPGSVLDSGCEDPNLPFCRAGANLPGDTCMACRNDALDAEGAGGVDSGCSEDQPLCNGAPDNLGDVCTAEEVHCTNDQSGGAQDDGCESVHPICDALDGQGGDRCVVCVNDLQTDEDDTGCSGSTPLCDAPPGLGGLQCAVCRNDQNGPALDVGCPADTPLCNGIPGSSGTGCMKCFNDQQGAGQDAGCEAETPICDTGALQFGGSCKMCRNNKAGQTPDSGCSGETPLCDAPLNEAGNQCKVCVNDQEDSRLDTGCPVDSPKCTATPGSLGDSCQPLAPCTNDVSGSGADTGCDDPQFPLCGAPPDQEGLECMHCINDAVDALATDLGCQSNAPLCVALFLHEGMQCAVCINDQSGGNVDSGCSPETPICDTPVGTAGSVCVLVQVEPQAFVGGQSPEQQLPTSVPPTPLAPGAPPQVPAAFVDASKQPQPSVSEFVGGNTSPPLAQPAPAGGNCLNDNLDMSPDTGCPQDIPLCTAAFGKQGDTCAICVNDIPIADQRDQGCPEDKRHCEADKYMFGQACSSTPHSSDASLEAAFTGAGNNLNPSEPSAVAEMYAGLSGERSYELIGGTGGLVPGPEAQKQQAESSSPAPEAIAEMSNGAVGGVPTASTDPSSPSPSETSSSSSTGSSSSGSDQPPGPQPYDYRTTSIWNPQPSGQPSGSGHSPSPSRNPGPPAGPSPAESMAALTTDEDFLKLMGLPVEKIDELTAAGFTLSGAAGQTQGQIKAKWPQITSDQEALAVHTAANNSPSALNGFLIDGGVSKAASDALQEDGKTFNSMFLEGLTSAEAIQGATTLNAADADKVAELLNGMAWKPDSAPVRTDPGNTGGPSTEVKTGHDTALNSNAVQASLQAMGQKLDAAYAAGIEPSTSVSRTQEQALKFLERHDLRPATVKVIGAGLAEQQLLTGNVNHADLLALGVSENEVQNALDLIGQYAVSGTASDDVASYGDVSTAGAGDEITLGKGYWPASATAFSELHQAAAGDESLAPVFDTTGIGCDGTFLPESWGKGNVVPGDECTSAMKVGTTCTWTCDAGYAVDCSVSRTCIKDSAEFFVYWDVSWPDCSASGAGVKPCAALQDTGTAENEEAALWPLWVAIGLVFCCCCCLALLAALGFVYWRKQQTEDDDYDDMEEMLDHDAESDEESIGRQRSQTSLAGTRGPGGKGSHSGSMANLASTQSRTMSSSAANLKQNSQIHGNGSFTMARPNPNASMTRLPMAGTSSATMARPGSFAGGSLRQPSATMVSGGDKWGSPSGAGTMRSGTQFSGKSLPSHGN
eukprot:gene3362-4_t